MADFNQDVSKYLRFLSDNLRLISSTGAEANAHNDLVPHILQQLRATTIPLFQQAILRWQRAYFESTLSLTPQSLVLKADQERQILIHAGQWVETIDPSITAMQASLQAAKLQSGELLQSLAANFSQLASKQRDIARSGRSST